MKINLDTYIISDTHFGHENIITYCNRPEDHDFVMYLYWKSIVSPEDNILHLGDVLWYKKLNAIDIVKDLPGNKFLIKGNHDKRNNAWFEDLGFTIMPKRVFFEHEDKTIVFTHYPEDRFDLDWDINIHGHIHNNSYEKKVVGDKTWINVSVEVMGYAPAKLGSILKEV